MIKEWLLTKILRNRIVLFENENQYFIINDIYFDEGVVICKKTDWRNKEWLKNYVITAFIVVEWNAMTLSAIGYGPVMSNPKLNAIISNQQILGESYDWLQGLQIQH